MTFNRIANSLATRIIVIGIMFLVLGIGIRYFILTQHLRDDFTKVMAAQQLTLANYVAREVNLKLQERLSMLTQIATSLPQTGSSSPAYPCTKPCPPFQASNALLPWAA